MKILITSNTSIIITCVCCVPFSFVIFRDARMNLKREATVRYKCSYTY